MDREQVIRELEASGDFRVLRRFVARQHYGTASPEHLRRALVVDVETTGLDPDSDAIIEFAAVGFSYCSTTGIITDADAPISWLEDPGRPIPAVVTELTGITGEMVAGKRIDDTAVAGIAAGAQLVIAHNAGFDRKFVSKRLPALADKPWACSCKEIPWRIQGSASSALEYLLLKHCGVFFDGHRAGTDCEALVHLLATPFSSGTAPMKLLLDSARKTTGRVWSLNSPIEFKDTLKARGYHWSPGDKRRPRAWFRDLSSEAVESEQQWLYENVYGGKEVSLKAESMDARRRWAD